MQGTVQEGDRITAQEVLLKRSAKGNEYHQLRKVKVEEGGPREVTKETVESNDLEARVSKLEEAVFGPKEDKIREVASEVKDEVVTDVDEEINLDDIPFN